MKSRCTQRPISKPHDALQIFNRKDETGEVPLVLVPDHRSVWDFFIQVPNGVCCLAQQFGKDVGEAPLGTSFHLPGYRIAYVVTRQTPTYNAPVKSCPTSDNVRVNVDVSVVFAISDPRQFVYKLGAVHFDQLLSGAVDEGIRLLVREHTHETVRTLRGSRAERMLDLLRSKFKDSGVAFHNCTITSMHLPKTLEQTLMKTTEIRTEKEQARRKQDYALLKIEEKAEIDLQALQRQHENMLTQEEGNRQAVQNKHRQAVLKYEEELRVAVIKAEETAKVKKMNLTAQLERTRLSVETERVDTIGKAEASAERTRVKAENEYFQNAAKADAEKDQLQGQAEAMRLDAQAEASASQHLQQKRKHELNMREKDVINELAQKCQFNLIGNHGDSLVDAVMSGQLQGTEQSSNKGWFK